MKDKTARVGLIFLGAIYFIGFILSRLFGSETFVHLTPIILFITVVFTFFTTGERKEKKFWLMLIGVGLGGYVTEVIGVHTALLFGSYGYSNVLGPSLLNVPLMIIFMWAFVSWSGYVLARSMKYPRLVATALGALFVMVFDLWLEPFAVKLGLWQWSAYLPGLFNYLCWFLISFLFINSFWSVNLETKRSYVIVSIGIMQLMFFSGMYFLAVRG